MKSGILRASVVFLIMSVSASALASTITLKNETSVIPSVVLLKDVAAVTGAESSAQLDTLGSTTICSAPPPAEAQIVTAVEVASALRASGADLSQLKFAGARQVTVRREYALVTVEELTETFSEHVSRQTGWIRDSFVVKPPKNVQPKPVPVGKRRITVETTSNEDFCGSATADLQVSVDGTPYCTLSHRFIIERYVQVLVAVGRISRGQPIQESDVKLTKLEQSSVDSGALTKMEQTAGLLAVRTIYPGTVVRAELLSLPPVIKRGQDVSVIWEGTGFSIETKGEALEDGCANKLVRVRLATKKIVKATALDSRTLQIAKQGD